MKINGKSRVANLQELYLGDNYGVGLIPNLFYCKAMMICRGPQLHTWPLCNLIFITPREVGLSVSMVVANNPPRLADQRYWESSSSGWRRSWDLTFCSFHTLIETTKNAKGELPTPLPSWWTRLSVSGPPGEVGGGGGRPPYLLQPWVSTISYKFRITFVKKM